MQPEQRRDRMYRLLSESREPVTGADLAEKFGVSRQVVVQDIALLRAQGRDILATPRGYVVRPTPNGATSRRTFASTHSAEGGEIARELNLIVDNGGDILDVIVEHPLYGELRGLLMIHSRHDVAEFVRSLAEQGARPMLSLTGGPHLHTVEALSTEALDRIEDALRRAGFLITEE